MFRTAMIAAIAATTITPAAFAADLYTPTIVPVTYASSGFDWSGIYAGAVGGYVWGTTTAVRSTGGATTTVDPSGGQLGITVGANTQFDQFVLGLEGEVLWSGVTGNATIAGGTNVGTVKSEWQGAIKARAGVAFDQILVYAHGGFAFADFHASVATAGGAALGDYRTSRTGWTVGAGVEVAVTDNVTVKGEYAYSDFGKWTGTVSGGLGDFDMTYTSHAVKVGVNFHF